MLVLRGNSGRWAVPLAAEQSFWNPTPTFVCVFLLKQPPQFVDIHLEEDDSSDEEYSPDEEEEDETAEEVSGCSLLVESEAGLHRKG
jgi:hypothetical protein